MRQFDFLSVVGDHTFSRTPNEINISKCFSTSTGIFPPVISTPSSMLMLNAYSVRLALERNNRRPSATAHLTCRMPNTATAHHAARSTLPASQAESCSTSSLAGFAAFPSTSTPRSTCWQVNGLWRELTTNEFQNSPKPDDEPQGLQRRPISYKTTAALIIAKRREWNGWVALRSGPTCCSLLVIRDWRESARLSGNVAVYISSKYQQAPCSNRVAHPSKVLSKDANHVICYAKRPNSSPHENRPILT